MSRLAESFILILVAAVVVICIMVYARISNRIEPVPAYATNYSEPAKETPKDAPIPPANTPKTRVAPGAITLSNVKVPAATPTEPVAALPGVPQVDPGMPVEIEMSVPGSDPVKVDKGSIKGEPTGKKKKQPDADKKKQEAALQETDKDEGIQPGSAKELVLLRQAQTSLNRLYQLKLRGYSTPALAEKEARKLVNIIDQLPAATRKRVRSIIDSGYGKSTRPRAMQQDLNGDGAKASSATQAELGKVDSTPKDVKQLGAQIQALKSKASVGVRSSSDNSTTTSSDYEAPTVEGSLDKEVKAQDL